MNPKNLIKLKGLLDNCTATENQECRHFCIQISIGVLILIKSSTRQRAQSFHLKWWSLVILLKLSLDLKKMKN